MRVPIKVLRLPSLIVATLLAALPMAAFAQSGAPALADAFSDRDSANRGEASPAPPGISGLMDLRQTEEEAEGNIIQQEGDKAADNAIGIRIDALKEAGLSFGARGGLAYRTFEIQRRLAESDTYLSQIYDFNRLLIPASSGLLIEPPIVNEATQALIIKTGGQEAAVADRVLKINRAARIVSAPRNWRTYLERDWGAVEPPPALLRPKDDREVTIWQASVKKGWDAGVEQADDIFQADLDRLTNDFTGMVRYRELVAQRMITPPYSAGDNRGVTGNASELRIGDRGVEITGPSQFVTKPDNWSPATR